MGRRPRFSADRHFGISYEVDGSPLGNFSDGVLSLGCRIAPSIMKTLRSGLVTIDDPVFDQRGTPRTALRGHGILDGQDIPRLVCTFAGALSIPPPRSLVSEYSLEDYFASTEIYRRPAHAVAADCARVLEKVCNMPDFPHGLRPEDVGLNSVTIRGLATALTVEPNLQDNAPLPVTPAQFVENLHAVAETAFGYLHEYTRLPPMRTDVYGV